MAEIALGWEVRPRREQNGRGLLVSEELALGCLQIERGLAVRAIWYIVTNDHTATETVLMGTPPKTLDNQDKVVVAFLNGGRTKGYVHDFSALEESFNLLPYEDDIQGEEVKIELTDLKAVFFVREFALSPKHYEALAPAASVASRRIEVTFKDGEKIVGRTEGYHPQLIGFFIFPAYPRDNNIRIFVITKNTRRVRLI
jgi:hypothetical protein